MTHPTDIVMDQWVSGMLDGPEGIAFEAHVDACPSCAVRLSVAARQELELFAVAETVRTPTRARGLLVLATLALAATALLVARTWVDPTPASAVAGVDVSVDCSALADPRDCERQAAARGLMTDSRDVPRYDTPTPCIVCGEGG